MLLVLLSFSFPPSPLYASVDAEVASFKITATPSAINLTAGETKKITITVARTSNTIRRIVNLYALNLPRNVSISFKPSWGRPPFISVATMKTDIQSEIGDFWVAIVGISRYQYASALVRLHISAPENRENGLAVVYYGWLVSDSDGGPSDAAQRIAGQITSKDILIASFYTENPRFVNLSPRVLSLVHSKGAKILAYIDTTYGTRPIEEVRTELGEYLLKGVDGIFFDCAPNLLNSTHYSYYSTLYESVKAHGSDKMVILNTGLSDKWTDEAVMNVTDILCVERRWTSESGFGTVWARKYPRNRFMGLSDGVTDWESAESLTRQAWDLGVGFHYSTNRYTSLEAWWEDYAGAVMQD